MFFTFLKLYKRSQIAQSITYGLAVMLHVKSELLNVRFMDDLNTTLVEFLEALNPSTCGVH